MSFLNYESCKATTLGSQNKNIELEITIMGSSYEYLHLSVFCVSTDAILIFIVGNHALAMERCPGMTHTSKLSVSLVAMVLEDCYHSR